MAVASAEAPSYGAPGLGGSGLSNAYGAPSGASAPSSSYGAPSSSGLSNSYGAPSGSSASGLSNSYGAPAAAPASSYGAPNAARLSNSYGAPAASSVSAPSSSYGAPAGASGLSNAYGAPGAGIPSGQSGIPSQAYGAGITGGRNSGINDGPIESEPNLELENEGANLPSDIVGQELLDRVIDAVSQDLAEQEAARLNAAAAQRSAYGAPAYGPPSGQYGAPGGAAGALGGPGSLGNGGRIMLLIPPDPLKARLIANYIQRGTRPVDAAQLAALGAAARGGYNGGNDLLRNGGGPSAGYSGTGPARSGY